MFCMTKDKNHIPIANIYHMLSYAYQSLQRDSYKAINTEPFEYVQDLFAAILSIGIAIQLKQGLRREYIEMQDNLSTVRGKIEMRGSAQLKMRGANRLSCCFDELSENHYMNRILKSTACCLINDKNVKRENKDTLKKAIWFFSGVDTLEPSAINWRALHYNRGNASYRMLMNVCYLVLHELLLTTDSGKQNLATFLDAQQMSRLYEKFILEYYKKHFPQYHPASKEIKWDAKGETTFLPAMQSDVMLTYANKKLVIDAKYYGKIMQSHPHCDEGTIRSSNLYQIFTYVKNEDKTSTGLVDGMLLYAKTDMATAPNVTYELNGNRISVKTLDLGQDFDGIKRELNTIVDEWQCVVGL